MGWFWADPNTQQNKSLWKASSATAISGQCPVMHERKEESISACPVMRERKEEPVSACPVMREKKQSDLNPLNNIPFNLSSERHDQQAIELPTERMISTIPRGTKKKEYWEYPSPQQMYNAMIKKGKIDSNTGEEIPEDAVESMVYVHNLLNEGSWGEILKWEQPHTKETLIEPKLLKFTGRPDKLSPRARWHHFLSNIFPSYYSNELPFDRHDWFVLRGDPNSTYLDDEGNEISGYKRIRYVLDFYGAPDDENGLPTFNIDVRPALDNFENTRDRFNHLMRPVLDKYFGSERSK
ncbi:holocytochrome c synthase CYC3 NDAI_0H01140 [Naumovozyma dairenensis CBS 421]|uniref:Holocytochrome c-type synthase n=1 Tax=Naumovozyma dairenensis (strain ATCC 10597 / BCRC 20456 / CBS 421 / NBRC 0211 / NRRL Y-12639) TaxID=1071378 RepID=G0WES7_NAUDC|nr:hypothetical protein NDAI_0H01140 [Naumovozyma dairenensis CBS 421]CCD26288.1 hypothetical protein NDAI_0H01140 [Naumovozyma dairenensis CBS 421]